MCVDTHVYIYICIRIYIYYIYIYYICIRIYIYMCVDVYVYIYIYVYIHIYIYICIHPCIYIHACMLACTYVCMMYVCMYLSIYVCMYVIHPHLIHTNVQFVPSPVSFAEVLGLVLFCQAPTPGIVVIAIVLGYEKVGSKPESPSSTEVVCYGFFLALSIFGMSCVCIDIVFFLLAH